MNSDRIRVHVEGKEYNVVGGNFQAMLAAIKQINGRRFVGELKVWQLPGSVGDIRSQLEISGFELEGGTPVAQSATPAQSPSAQSRDRIRVRVEGKSLAVVGGTFQEMLAVVKNLPGRRFDGDSKVWEIPGDVGVIQGMIMAAGFELEGAGNVSSNPVSPMEAPLFAGESEPPPFEQPDFAADNDPLPFAPPDWLDDDDIAPPPEPPDWWDDDLQPPPADYGEAEPDWEDDPNPPGPAPITTAKSGGDRIRIRVGGIPMVVTGGTFQEMLTAIKQIPGRRFDGQDKVWDIPAEVGLEKAKQMMNVAGFELGRG